MCAELGIWDLKEDRDTDDEKEDVLTGPYL